jgi:alpha-ketoglutarate-dependent taurine dioxygenase
MSIKIIISIYLINAIHSIHAVDAYKITFPTLKRNYAVISNVNIKSITDYEKTEFIKLFNAVPLIMFKNQKIDPVEYYEFCKLFDDKHTDEIIHPFDYSRIDTVPQIALRGNCYIKDLHGIKDTYLKYSDPFKNTLVWHQDIVGQGTYLPPVVSSMYMIKSPTKGGNTLFASLEDAYDNIDIHMKDKLFDLKVIYSNTNSGIMNSYFDYTGYNRVKLNEIPVKKEESIITKEPLVVYSNYNKNRKALMLSPFRFAKFDKMSCSDSFDLYRELMSKYIVNRDNIVDVKWDNNDLLIFNNRKLIHTSTPTLEYKDNERLYYSCFLGTKAPIAQA